MVRKNVGAEIIGDLVKCNQKTLLSQRIESLRREVSQLIKKYELTEIGSYYHQFNPGMAGVIALAESHIAFHTWPKEKYVSLNVFVCNYTRDNTKNANKLFKDLSNLFDPGLIKKQRIIRKVNCKD